MPIEPETDRRASSPKVASDVLRSQKPVITQAAYLALIRNQGGEANLQVKQLAQAKNLLGQAMPIVKALIRHYQKINHATMFRELRKIERDVDRAYMKMPLDIQNK